MKSIYLLTLTLLGVSLPAISRELTPEEAYARATGSVELRAIRGIKEGTPRHVYTAMTADSRPAVYVYNTSRDNGYIVLSADDSAAPVLGYSETGSFKAGGMPPQLEWWLSEYSRQIEYARANNMPAYKKQRTITRGEREAVAPLLKTKWDQVEPYNEQCPLDGVNRTWTGCVATAMAQVMKYWNYPEKGTGSITYTIESLEKKVSMNFGQKKFDWDNMIDSYIPGYYNETEASAVAYLMKACGYSVKMQYSMDASGALGMNIGNALVKYFGYDGNLLYTLRQYYSSTEWDEMMYTNLKEVGPVLMGGGSALGGGHSFVCDGYDGEGMYHFNWGWSGMSDGYFALSALNPDSLGIGGGSGGGYNFSQDAIFGVQPSTGAPVEERKPFITQEGVLTGKLSAKTLSFQLANAGDPMWVNYNPKNLKVKFGAMFYKQGEDNVTPIYRDISNKRLSLDPGYGTSPQIIDAKINLANLPLGNGTYKVVCGTVEVSTGTTSSATDGEGFTEVRPGYGNANYFYLTVENGTYRVTNEIPAPLKITGEVVGGLYYGMLNTIRITVENPTDIERRSGFAPVFVDEEGPLLLGESICLNIPPHGTVTKEWSTGMQQFVTWIDPFLGTDVIFTFYNEEDYEFYNDVFTQTVKLNANPGIPKVKVSKAMKVVGGKWEGITTVIPDASNIELTGELTLTDGYFNYPVVACLCVPAANDQVEIVATAGQNICMTMENEETRVKPFNIHLSYPIGDPKERYSLVLTYKNSDGLNVLSNAMQVKFKDVSGVEDISEDSGLRMIYDRKNSTATILSEAGLREVSVYDISGRTVTGGTVTGTTATITLPAAGIYMIHVTDNSGNVRSFKTIK